MMQRKGFTFIELSISLFLAAVLSLLLYRSLSESQRTVQTINSMVDFAFAAPAAYNQLERDITALFVPERVFKDLEEKNKQSATNNNNDKQKKQEPFKNIFVGTAGADKNITALSFLSTNSLILYAAVKPRSVRVMYRLVPDADRPGLFTLTRQETVDLETPLAKFSEGSAIRSYDLMRSIKNFTVHYKVPEKKEEPQKANAQGQQKPQQKKGPTAYTTLDTWDGEEAAQKTGSMIPAFVLIKGVFMDIVTEREYDFEWRFEIMAFADVAERAAKAKKKSSEKKEEPKSPAGPNTTGGIGTGGVPKQPPNQNQRGRNNVR